MTVLKVSKVSNPHSVAGAIAGLVRDTGRAVMQAIGASATNQAVKAIAIARSFMREEGIDLLARVTFLDVEFGGETRTALRFEIANRETFPADEAPVEPSAAIGTTPDGQPAGAPRPSRDADRRPSRQRAPQAAQETTREPPEPAAAPEPVSEPVEAVAGASTGPGDAEVSE